MFLSEIMSFFHKSRELLVFALNHSLSCRLGGELSDFFSPRGLTCGRESDFPFLSAGTSFNCVSIHLVFKTLNFRFDAVVN